MIVFNINDVEVQLTKEQADLFNPTARKSDKSLPVEVPSTPEMDELFADAYEINGSIRDDVNWNPNHKADCMLVDGSGIVLLRGYAQLKKITTKGTKIYYEVDLFGKIKDLFTDIGEKLIVGNDDPSDDLSFTEYTHTYDVATAIRTWEFDCDVNLAPTDLTNQGKGYLYPIIDVGTSDYKKYNFADFRPNLYYWEILYKIFEKAGIRWDSEFLESTFFKRLHLPFMGEQMMLTDSVMLDLSASASRTGSAHELSFYNTPVGNSGPDRSTGEIVIFNNEISDPSVQYNNSNGEFTATDNGEYIVDGQLISYIKYIGSASKNYPTAPSFDYYGNIHFEVIKDSGGGSFTPVYAFTVRTYFNNLTSPSPGLLTTNTVGEYITGEGKFQSDPFILKAGEKCYIKAYYYQDDYFGAWFSQALAYVDTTSFINFSRTSTVVAGQELDPTICLPNMKQKDFLAMVIKRFNLYLDPIDDRRITIEPRDDFFIDTTQNWEQYRATDQDLDFFPMSLLDAKQYDFIHTKDEDLLNKQYFNSYGFVYGRKRIFTENEFLDQVREINDGIAPTPSISHYDRILPCITYIDSGGQVIRKSTKPRMLYYGGTDTCTAYKIVENGVETDLTEYPYSGMQDSPYTPTFTLTWGIPNEIYYKRYPAKDQLVISSNDLYNAYWTNTINQIANKDSRVVQGWFWIDAERYYNASFRDQYWFNNAYHRLLKIEDWVASSDSTLVKCTFLKLQRVDTPEINTTTVGGGRSGNGNGSGGTAIDNQKVPDWIRNAPLGGGGVMTGEDGTDGYTGGSGQRVIMNAPRVNIGDSTRNTSVFGGQGVNVPSKQNNVTYVNSELESPIDNVTVINNLIQKTDRIVVTHDQLGDIDTTPLMLIMNTIEGSSIYINSVYGLMAFDTDVYQNRDIHVINDDADILFNFGTNFTNNATDTLRASERQHPHILKRDQNIYLSASGLMTTGLGDLTLIINYTILLL